MRVVVSRVDNASVCIKDKLIGKCDKGLLILSCFKDGDNINDIEYIVRKVLNLRIFDDEMGIMNKSILDIGGNILSVSQFTLYADTSKGNRPSYINALNGDEAIKLYNIFNERLRERIEVQTGEFGAEMEIRATHNGPVTIILDSK